MRIGNLSGRLTLLTDTHALDVESASDGLFGSDPSAVYARWAEFSAWATLQDIAATGSRYSTAALGPAVPRPAQIFAIGLNYASHAGESGFAVPENPVVFTKFASSLVGPDATVELTGPRVDWEAELVAVIGTGGRDIPETDAWSHIAGLTVGQDLSDRTVQFWGDPPQFSLGKSRAGFGPIGPWVVTLDEIDRAHDRDDLAIRCTVLGPDDRPRVLQDGRTRDMVFSVPALVARLSAVVELLPGDIVFTGTPEGVGVGRDPQLFLQPGQVLVTEIAGVGSIRQRFTTPAADA